MDWLNYHHLLYFWTIVKEGSISRASKVLRLAQPTISGQIRVLETHLGQKLFTKAGRGLALTEFGELVYRYADEIFSLGREMMEVIQGRPSGGPMRLVAGISDTVPKLVAYRILAPALEMAEPVRMVCQEDKTERLLRELATQGVDLVLADAPVPPGGAVKAFNHLLGSCGVTLMGTAELAGRYRKSFPQSLDGAPFLMPIAGSTLREALEQWFDAQQIRPRVAGEFQDSALLKVFGQAGVGVFAVPSVIEKEVRESHNVAIVGRVKSIVERFYAISVERKIKHPAVAVICGQAKEKLFGMQV